MIRPILHYPDPRLRKVAEPVEVVDDTIRKLVDDMAETMYAAPGVGLAAPQIGESRRIFIMDIAKEEEPSDLRVFINPEIVERHGEIAWEEGCLSFPGAREEITRAERIRVRALDRDGKTFELVFEGLAAVAVQHENDHLDGKLMIDHLSLIRRRLLHREMSKIATAKRRDKADDEAAE